MNPSDSFLAKIYNEGHGRCRQLVLSRPVTMIHMTLLESVFVEALEE
jgi:hypothetical protein